MSDVKGRMSFEDAMSTDPNEFERLMLEKRKSTSMPSLIPEEFKAEDRALTESEEAEAQEIATGMKRRDTAQRVQDLGEELSLAGLAPTVSGQVTGFVGDLLYSGGAGARFLMGEEGAGTEAAMGLAAAALPIIPIAGFARALKRLRENPDAPATREARELYQTYVDRVKAGELSPEDAATELKPLMDDAGKQAAYEGMSARNEAAAAARGAKTRLTPQQIQKTLSRERQASDEASKRAAMSTRQTDPTDMDLYGKASVGEFAGGAGTFTPGGRARDLDEAKRLRGSRKDPAQEYGSGEAPVGPRTAIIGGKKMFARPGAAGELSKLRQEWRKRGRKDKKGNPSPLPTEADVPSFFVSERQYKSMVSAASRDPNAARKLRSRRVKKLAGQQEALEADRAKRAAAEAAKRPTQYNELEMEFIQGVPKEQQNAARKLIDEQKAAGQMVAKDAKGQFGFRPTGSGMTQATQGKKKVSDPSGEPPKDVAVDEPKISGSKINTPNFKSWFGRGVIAKNSGEPIPLYHSTTKSFDAFEPSKEGLMGPGIYTSLSSKHVNDYIVDKEKRTIRRGANVIPLFSSIRNPAFLLDPIGKDRLDPILRKLSDAGIEVSPRSPDGINSYWDLLTSLPAEDRAINVRGKKIINEALQDMGHDSSIFSRRNDFIRYRASNFVDTPEDMHVLVFDPTNVKSPYNKGTFDPTDPSILKGIGVGATIPAATAARSQRQEEG
tara:strand:- start:23396 stop:25567 length:2172 start_codon:yes stop_codon:yes gene_type:complete